MAPTLHDLREITVRQESNGHVRSFPTLTALARWGGVDAVDLYGCCPVCGCTKSGDVREANTATPPCTNERCLCHDADVVSTDPLVVLLGVERHWPYACRDEADRP